MPQNATWETEKTYWEQGITIIAGVDEVGMGALAGPVVAAAVAWDTTHQELALSPPLRDSKTLSAVQREKLVPRIQEAAAGWGIGVASVAEIDELNIRNASHLAMRRAVVALTTTPDLLLADGRPVQIHETIPTEALVGGDALCCSIAAASILAKVHRDTLMQTLDVHFPGYGFAQHKGYGSASHLAALKEHGAASCHRRSYAPVAAVLPNSG